MLDGKNVLITGGTGSFGKYAVKTILERYKPQKLIVFSRDELKQFEMAQRYGEDRYPCMRYFLGDVRDLERLREAFREVDVVIHAAALKQVPAGEYNPFEVIQTNILGAQNVIRSAIERRVQRVIALSTDKAANPINLYGATKLCSDKLFVAGTFMAGKTGTTFAVVRYGNVVGSRGSVIPFFLEKRKSGVIPVTDPRMTRFLITLPQGVEFVLRCLENMRGGELFVPKLPSCKIIDIVKAVAPEAALRIIGIRPGEKLHEVMVPVDDARNTIEFDDHFIISPSFPWSQNEVCYLAQGGRRCAEDFHYASDNNTKWLGVEEIQKLVEHLGQPQAATPEETT